MNTVASRILVVEDDIDARQCLRLLLEANGYVVMEADGGHAALAILDSSSVDLVLSDIRMPKGNGIELLKRIRECRVPPSVIFLSGFFDLAYERALDLGAEAVIAKPLDSVHLLEVIKQVLLPVAERWSVPSTNTDDDFVFRTQMQSLGVDGGGESVLVGRGGLFLPLNNAFPQVGTMVDFDITFADGAPQLTGRGRVVWVRQIRGDDLMPGIGVAFVAMNAVGRDRIVGLLESLQPIAFIPLGRIPNPSANQAESRRHQRHVEMAGTLPGTLLGSDQKLPIKAQVIEASRYGLGIAVNDYVLPGSYVWLERGDRRFRFEVVYCTADFERQSAYRCGLIIREAEVDVLSFWGSNSAS